MEGKEDRELEFIHITNPVDTLAAVLARWRMEISLLFKSLINEYLALFFCFLVLVQCMQLQ